MTTESTTADPGPAPARRRPRRGFRGGWYFVISIASAGFLAWVPFVHAATRLGRPRPVIRNAVLFGAGAVVLGVLAALSPTTAEGHPATTTSAVMEPIYVISMLCVIAGACLLQAPLRRRVFFGEKPAEPAVDPAVAAVLAARARRDEARELARRDPLLARELHIGRPDLHGAYDDGGLVDLDRRPPRPLPPSARWTAPSPTRSSACARVRWACSPSTTSSASPRCRSRRGNASATGHR